MESCLLEGRTAGAGGAGAQGSPAVRLGICSPPPLPSAPTQAYTPDNFPECIIDLPSGPPVLCELPDTRNHSPLAPRARKDTVSRCPGYSI